MKRFSAIAIIIICQGIVNQLYGQWKNEIFRNPQMEKSDSNALDIEQLISGAEKVANFVTSKFSGVETPATPDIDLQSLVNKVAKDMFPQK